MIIGLTGGLGTGKTTVAGMMRALGAYVIDADKIVHGILSKPLRRRLGDFIFDDKAALEALCRAVHPIVKKKIFSDIRENKGKKIIVIDAPLLIESGLHKRCAYLIVVKSPLKKQLERAAKKLSLSRSRALKRIRLQMPLREKAGMADFVINNGGSLKDTQRQVKRLWENILDKEREWKN